MFFSLSFLSLSLLNIQNQGDNDDMDDMQDHHISGPNGQLIAFQRLCCLADEPAKPRFQVKPKCQITLMVTSSLEEEAAKHQWTVTLTKLP